MAFAQDHSSSKKRGRGKRSAPPNSSTPSATSVVLPSRALGQLHETLTLHSDLHNLNANESKIQIQTPEKSTKMVPKMSKSAMRRRRSLDAEAAHALANTVPTINSIAPPMPPIILARTFQKTIVQITLIDLPPLQEYTDYKVCDFQLQVSKGGNLI